MTQEKATAAQVCEDLETYKDYYTFIADKLFRHREPKADVAALQNLQHYIASYGKPLAFLNEFSYKRQIKLHAPSMIKALADIRDINILHETGKISLEQMLRKVYPLDSFPMQATMVLAHELGYFRNEMTLSASGTYEHPFPSNDTTLQDKIAHALVVLDAAKASNIVPEHAIAQTLFAVEEAPRLYTAVQSLLTQKKTQEARDAIQRIRDKAAALQRESLKSVVTIDGALSYATAQSYMLEGNFEKAERNFQSALLAPDSEYSPLFGVSKEKVYAELAHTYLQLGKLQDMETLLAKGTKELREHTNLDVLAASFEATAFAYFKQKNDYRAAVGFFRARVKEHLKQGSTYLYLLQSIVQKAKGKPVEGDLKYAKYVSGKAVEYTPATEMIRFAEDRIREKDYTTADILLSAALGKNTPSAGVYTTYATLLRARGNEPRAKYYDFKAKKALPK